MQLEITRATMMSATIQFDPPNGKLWSDSTTIIPRGYVTQHAEAVLSVFAFCYANIYQCSVFCFGGQRRD